MTKQVFARFLREESGQDLIEYALMVALIALAAVGAMTSFTSHVGDEFNTLGSNM